MTPSRHSVPAPLTPATALALLLAACGGDGGTGPGPTKLADPLATAAKIQAIDVSFGSPVFQSFSFASIYSPAASSSLTALRMVLRAARPVPSDRPSLSSGESRLAAAALRAALVSASGATIAPFVPPQLRGKTYEWNPTTFRYEVTARTGAPVDGVRFILYALDVGGAPIVDQEIGHADLKDEGTGRTEKLHIVVVGLDGLTYVDYTVRLTTTSTSGTLTVVGHITDGTHRLDFNATVAATASTVSVDIRLDDNAEAVHVRLKLTFTFSNSATVVDLRLQVGAEVVTITGSETLNGTATGTYTVRVNGGIYATITVTNGLPSYSGGGGQQLTHADLTALNAIYSAQFTVFLMSAALLAPAGLIVGF